MLQVLSIFAWQRILALSVRKNISPLHRSLARADVATHKRAALLHTLDTDKLNDLPHTKHLSPPRPQSSRPTWSVHKTPVWARARLPVLVPPTLPKF